MFVIKPLLLSIIFFIFGMEFSVYANENEILNDDAYSTLSQIPALLIMLYSMLSLVQMLFKNNKA